MECIVLPSGIRAVDNAMMLDILLETTQATTAVDAAITASLGCTPETIIIHEDFHLSTHFDMRIPTRVERRFVDGDVTHWITVYYDETNPPAVQTDITFAQALVQRLDARAYAEPETAHFPDDFVRVLASGELQPVEIDQSDDGLRFTMRPREG